MWWLIGYLVGFVVCMRMAYPRALDQGADAFGYDWEGKALAGVMAVTAAMLWPMIVVGAIILWRPSKTKGQIKAESEARKAKIVELESENDRLRKGQEE